MKMDDLGRTQKGIIYHLSIILWTSQLILDDKKSRSRYAPLGLNGSILCSEAGRGSSCTGPSSVLTIWWGSIQPEQRGWWQEDSGRLLRWMSCSLLFLSLETTSCLRITWLPFCWRWYSVSMAPWNAKEAVVLPCCKLDHVIRQFNNFCLEIEEYRQFAWSASVVRVGIQRVNMNGASWLGKHEAFRGPRIEPSSRLFRVESGI